MEVTIEQGKERSVFVLYVEYFYVWMIYRHCCIGTEGDAIEARGKSEHPFLHVGEFEIRTKHLAVDVEALLFQLVGVIREIPWLKVRIELAYGFHFLLGCGHIGFDELVE